MDTQSTMPAQNLPAWMLHARRGTDWGMIGALLFALLIAWPFWTGSEINLLNANKNHVFMISDIAQSLREGQIYPRWSAYAQDGYGAPIPNFYPTGIAYTGAVIELFFTNDPVVALRILYTLAFLAAGCAMYAFTSRWMGTKAGLLASLLYVSSPYLSLTAPHISGDLHAFTGYALLPALLWAISRRITINSRVDSTFISLFTAAILLTDLRLAIPPLLITPLLLFWHRYVQRKRVTLQVLRPVLLGIIAVGFFLIPAFVESNEVNWVRQSPYHPETLLIFEDLIQPFTGIDPLIQNPSPRFTLGYGFWLIMAAGSIGAAAQRKRSSLPFLMVGLLVVLMRTLLILFSEQSWFTGTIIFCGAVLGGAAVYLDVLFPQRLQKWVFAVLAGLVLLSTIPMLKPLHVQPFPIPFNAEGQLEYQREGLGTAVLPPGWELPSPFMSELLASNVLPPRTINDSRINVDQIYRDVQITTLSTTNHGASYQIDSAQPLIITYQVAEFPGWSATLNGGPLPASANARSGLLEIDVPAVRNGMLDIAFGSTQIRNIGWFITGLAVLTMIWVYRRNKPQSSTAEQASTRSNTTTPNTVELIERIPEAEIYRTLPVIVLWLILVLLYVNFGLPLYPVANGGIQRAVPINHTLPSGITLASYNMNQTTLHANQYLEIALFWQTDRTQDRHLLTDLSLENTGSGARYLRQARRYAGGLSSKFWGTEGYIIDTYRIPISGSIPAGDYRITLELFTCTNGCDSIESPVDTLTLPDVTISIQE